MECEHGFNIYCAECAKKNSTVSVPDLLVYLDGELQDARCDADNYKDTTYGKVRAGEAIAYANVIQWIKNVE